MGDYQRRDGGNGGSDKAAILGFALGIGRGRAEFFKLFNEHLWERACSRRGRHIQYTG
ncbi:hypothetical protein EMIT0P253_150080 [Pseudomonas sp. IT-P253]